ncbi:1-(5-phosphoribosyl)-5-[(5-phosphoribosylamino)methylideneamino]imidazole-4-carboxamide isomerase [Companilactobacillus pabuli]|jgi:phosphoribosylformimino-5-aminoimidazole carboxamide ribotide isomerase|uniref:1-(5-phosphoribosyl)-5-[(5-phosphoribosylamino)methylideneamino] imidazole-4-carboxamide isomerase n=1 Tax=Companilactobacillus pabuli TaxID=2714036 RepID=A0A7L7KUK6_9LACO|nr:1-(5-phosphoribosyl)-5-[(5-phosphoribosylamino)methylideneamino]imidazole-4-carboxamide isomerase [Companilactobacillus pabuli]AKP03406.1 1-(5-phosphoribosyl)-5-[(5-phosphoribosylamino)methylideneamino] imidazole-4-carboxamide isomerase [Companilactobacillus farciminis]AKS51709.1 1-(5-phosphoribosyl)-5-[(5-phosphoribosylamino)methylideneamino] imidazole-4-carboxamide isomerase [Companilactobacillus farciminis]MDG5112521.1 1-(5-phosphoribosyl)-5-[(5-phosphoribosylamino)methylideneamino]imidazo
MIFPAIDLKNGQSVRLYQGDYQAVTTINEEPIQQALEINKAGIKQLHLVDLDGAKSGQPENLPMIKQIRQNFRGFLELGGGIRTYQIAQQYLNLGIDRIVIGSAALKNPQLVKQLLDDFGSQKIAIGIDGKNGQVATEGWLEQSDVKMTSLISKMNEFGAENFIVTDVSRDGAMQGPNLDLLTNLREEIPQVNLIASGGIRNVEDLKALQKMGIEESIIGKALFEKTISLSQILEVEEC